LPHRFWRACCQLRRAAAGRPGPARPKVAQLSAEVVDSNPYSRLMALKRMGIVDNYEVRPATTWPACDLRRARR